MVGFDVAFVLQFYTVWDKEKRKGKTSLEHEKFAAQLNIIIQILIR